jgi:probable HAF family extracellular repeat protein
MRTQVILLLAALAGVCAQTAIAQAPSYQVRDLGTLGGRFANAADLNDAGQITGYSETIDGQIHAFLYDGNQMLDLGEIAAGGSVGRALNDSGAVTGLTGAADGLAHAFRSDANGMADLGVAGLSSAGNDINNAGDVAGEAVDATGVKRAAVFRSGSILDLGTPAGLTSSAAAINDAGQVAGTYEDSAGSHAFVFTGTAATDLVPGRISSVLGNQAINVAGQVVGSFDGDDGSHCFVYQNAQASDPGSLGGGYCVGLGINGLGVATGLSATATGERHAFALSGGLMTDLGALSGGLSIGYAINDAGMVAGEATVAEGGSHAVVFANGAPIDLAASVQALSTLPVTGSSAFDINSSGQVLGRFTFTDPADGSTQTHAFLATPATSIFQKLLILVQGIGPGNSLVHEVLDAQAHYLAQDVAGSCSILNAFTGEVVAQSGKHLDFLTATVLTAETAVVRLAIGC